jgi:hypothetical protein
VLTDQIVSLFPKIDGDVIEAQGTAVTLGLGKKDGVVAGIDLEIYREGRELRHPKTGASLGRTEQPVGRMQVQQVFEAYSTGTAAQGTEVRPGDKARVSSGKIKLSLLSAVDVESSRTLSRRWCRKCPRASTGRDGSRSAWATP